MPNSLRMIGYFLERKMGSLGAESTKETTEMPHQPEEIIMKLKRGLPTA